MSEDKKELKKGSKRAIKPHKFDAPCQIVVSAEEFKEEHLSLYFWSHVGTFFESGIKMLCIKVDGEK